MATEGDNDTSRHFLSLQSIQDILECIICLEVPRNDPIYQCDNGHLLCVKCYKKVSTCPLCKLELRKNRALAVEKILRKCPRACINQDNGCSILMRQLSLKEHEKICSFKPPMPSKLSVTDKSRFADILSEYECTYNHEEAIGVSRNLNFGCVRADRPIPYSLEAIYYFEVEVLREGTEGEPSIGIGLTAEGSLLTSMPGWENHTVGYHSDDGNFFNSCYQGNKYGPKFGTNDIIGCGLDLNDMSVFYTKNGKYLGVACYKLPDMTFYPTIGLHSKNEKVKVNFGQNPFAFKIKSLSGNICIYKLIKHPYFLNH